MQFAQPTIDILQSVQHAYIRIQRVCQGTVPTLLDKLAYMYWLACIMLLDLRLSKPALSNLKEAPSRVPGSVFYA